MEIAKPVATPIDVGTKLVYRFQIQSSSSRLTFSPQGTDECTGYSDADRGGDVEDCKSISGYLLQVSGYAVSWWSMEAVVCDSLYC